VLPLCCRHTAKLNAAASLLPPPHYCRRPADTMLAADTVLLRCHSRRHGATGVAVPLPLRTPNICVAEDRIVSRLGGYLSSLSFLVVGVQIILPRKYRLRISTIA
jgi:hypothetical protein